MRRCLWIFATLAAMASLAPAQLKAVKKNWWEISVSYPTFHSKGIAAKTANHQSRRLERNAFDAFLAEAKKEMPRLKKMKAPGHYTLSIVPAITADRPDLASGYVQRDEYEAGAHPHTSFQAMNYGSNGHEVALKDFVRGGDPVAIASDAIVKQFKRSKRIPSSIADGTWKRLDGDQARKFAVTSKGLLFLFDEAELGAHYEGYFKVLVPFSMLAATPPEQHSQPMSAAHPLYGRWVLESIQYKDGKVLKPESPEADWIKFDDKGKLSGRASTNSIGGSVSLGEPPALSLGPLFSTRMANPPHSIAPQFLQALATVNRYSLKDLKLTLETANDAVVLLFRRG